MLDLVRLAGLDRVLPHSGHPGQVGRMYRIRGPPLPQLVKRPTEVIKDLAVDVFNTAIGCHDRDEARDGLDDQTEALLTGGRSLLGVRPRFGPGIVAQFGHQEAPWAIRRRPGHSRASQSIYIHCREPCEA
jgi:hypothetical protein